MTQDFPATEAVIEAFARLETQPARTIVTELNLTFAKAMGVKLENRDAEDHAGPDGVLVLAAAELAALLQSGVRPYHPSILK